MTSLPNRAFIYWLDPLDTDWFFSLRCNRCFAQIELTCATRLVLIKCLNYNGLQAGGTYFALPNMDQIYAVMIRSHFRYHQFAAIVTAGITEC